MKLPNNKLAFTLIFNSSENCSLLFLILNGTESVFPTNRVVDVPAQLIRERCNLGITFDFILQNASEYKFFFLTVDHEFLNVHGQHIT